MAIPLGSGTRRLPALAIVLTMVAAGSAGCSDGAKSVADPFSAVSPSTSNRAVLISMVEGTTDRTSPCWTNYSATVDESGTIATIAVRDRLNKPGTVCAALAVSGFYLVVGLPRPINGSRVRDATTGLIHRLGPTISPPAGQLIGRLPG